MQRFSTFSHAAGALLLAAWAAAAQPAGPRFRMGFGGAPGWADRFLHGTVTGAPFSATETTTTERTLSNGTRIDNQHQSTVYRDTDGRVRIDTTITRPASATGGAATSEPVSTIYDPVAGYIYRLNPAKMTAVQSPLPKHNPPAAPPSGSTHPTHNPPAGVQVDKQSLGTSTINGVTANGTKVTTTVAAGAVGNSAALQNVRTTWIAPSLQLPVEITESGPEFGTHTLNLTNIVTAAPDPSLFEVPSGYTVTAAPGHGAGRAGFRH